MRLFPLCVFGLLAASIAQAQQPQSNNLTAGETASETTPLDCRAAAYAGGVKCDGATDDSAAIQACWNAAGAKSGTSSVARLPKGTCNISSTLIAPNPSVQLQSTTLEGEEQVPKAMGSPTGGTILKWAAGATPSNNCPATDAECSSGKYPVPVGIDLWDVSHTHIRSITVDMTGSTPATSKSIGIWYHSNNKPSSSHNSVELSIIAGAHIQLVCGARDNLAPRDLDHYAQADSFDFERNAVWGKTDQSGVVDETAVGIHVNSQNCFQQSRIEGNLFNDLSHSLEVFETNGGWIFAHNNSGPPIGERIFIYYAPTFVGAPPELNDNETEDGPLWAVYDLSCSAPNFTEQWSGNQFGGAVYVGGCNTVRSMNVSAGNPYFGPWVVAGNATVFSFFEPNGPTSGTAYNTGWLTADNIMPFHVAKYAISSLIKDQNGNVEQSTTRPHEICRVAPSWPSQVGETVVEDDCGVSWKNLGPMSGGSLSFWNRVGGGKGANGSGDAQLSTQVITAETIHVTKSLQFADGSTLTSAGGGGAGVASASGGGGFSPSRQWSVYGPASPNQNLIGWSTFTPDAPVRVQRISAHLFSAALSGCSVPPQIGVTDGKNFAYVSIPSGAGEVNAAATGSTTFAANVPLHIRTVAGSGCGGAPSSFNVTVSYAIQ